jgi:hypothetical protein
VLRKWLRKEINMRVEITDREYWLDKVEEQLSEIYYIRDGKQGEWDKMPWWKKFFNTDPYEYEYGWIREVTLKDIRAALLTQKTRAIYFGYNELAALGVA